MTERSSRQKRRTWIFLLVAGIVLIAVGLGWRGFFSSRWTLVEEVREGPLLPRRLPDDLAGVSDANYASLDGLAPGSREAQERQRQAVQQLGLPLEVKTRKTGIVFRLIPPGSFTMGSPQEEQDEMVRAGQPREAIEDEGQHKATLRKAFYCGKFEVTQGQWQQVMRTNPSYFKSAGIDAAVEKLNWEDCQNFLRKLCQMEGVGEGTYRLLTEAEWEYACRAGTQTASFNGELVIKGSNNGPALDAIAWYGGNSQVDYEGAWDSSSWPQKQYDHKRAGTHLVGGRRANAFGLCDMIGNVSEWCQDWYGRYPSRVASDPPGPRSGDTRVYRGGSWLDCAWCCRSADRKAVAPDHRYFSGFVGLRLARIMPSEPATPVPVASPMGGRNLVLVDLGMEMVYIEPGSFQMGSNSVYSDSDEKPVHAVRISRPFWMGKCEVTESQYQVIAGTNPSEEPDLPVTVSHKDAVAFCRRLTDRERRAGRLPVGYVYRLPTEAEWEYAARGGAKSLGFEYAGSANPDDVAWYSKSGGKTHPVGQKKPNEVGLHDMSGNVWEWCHDVYDASYYATSPSSDPTGPSSGDLHVLRGGSWRTYPGMCTVSIRKTLTFLNWADFDNGFRVVASWPLD
jgi:formylglycine-generating enzyme required for sulfatase activity